MMLSWKYGDRLSARAAQARVSKRPLSTSDDVQRSKLANSYGSGYNSRTYNDCVASIEFISFSLTQIIHVRILVDYSGKKIHAYFELLSLGKDSSQLDIGRISKSFDLPFYNC